MRVIYEKPDVKFIEFDIEGRIMDDIFEDEWLVEDTSPVGAPIPEE